MFTLHENKYRFDEMDIKSSLNTIEFSLREFNTGSFPKGLSLMLGIMSQWVYDKEPFEGIICLPYILFLCIHTSN